MTAVWFRAAADDGIARIVLDRPDDSINAINLEFIEALADAVREARAAQPRGLIVVSAKTGQWVAGADLQLVTHARNASEVEAAGRRLQAVLDELAWLPFTTVAAISGPALGGGLELALACDYRVAADDKRVVLGQPEVNLGLVPAGGGTQRLPRLIGIEPALDLILTGRRLNPRRARRRGLLDEVVHPTVLDQAARAWAGQVKRPLSRPLRSRMDLVELTPIGRNLIYGQAHKKVLERTHGHYPAPLRALDAVRTGFERGMAAGLEAEARAFGEVATTEAARNLIWLFMHSRPQRVEVDARVGVVGGGFMGAAIAEVAAVGGMPVRVKDVSPRAVAHALARIRGMLARLEPRERAAALGRVSATTDYSGFRTADLVIEAVFENLDLKRKVLTEVEAATQPETVIASNTSAIPIAEIACAARHPERVVGMHFFSPAERMPLLEVVRPQAANEAAVQKAVSVGVKMGKTPIVVSDAPGFYTTRVLGVMLNEAALLLGEGARIENVDQAMTEFGFPVGPFVLYDEVGLAVAQRAGETVARAFGERIPAATIVADLVARGDTGRKVGRGFLIWPQRTANPFVYGTTARRTFAPDEVQQRLVLLFVNEAIRCLEEGVIQSPTDGDLGAVLGLGFPPFKGGPFHYADSIGSEILKQKLQELAARHGQRYAPTQTTSAATRFYA